MVIPDAVKKIWFLSDEIITELHSNGMFEIGLSLFSIFIPNNKDVIPTRIEFFRKNYREIHGNQRIPNFPGIFTVFTVIFTGNRGNFYRNSR